MGVANLALLSLLLILHAVAGTLIPLLVVALMTRFFGKERSIRAGLEVWPFALFAALAMTIPYVLAASAVVGIVGLVGRAGWVIRKTLIVLAYYALLAR